MKIFNLEKGQTGAGHGSQFEILFTFASNYHGNTQVFIRLRIDRVRFGPR